MARPRAKRKISHGRTRRATLEVISQTPARSDSLSWSLNEVGAEHQQCSERLDLDGRGGGFRKNHFSRIIG